MAQCAPNFQMTWTSVTTSAIESQNTWNQKVIPSVCLIVEIRLTSDCFNFLRSGGSKNSLTNQTSLPEKRCSFSPTCKNRRSSPLPSTSKTLTMINYWSSTTIWALLPHLGSCQTRTPPGPAQNSSSWPILAHGVSSWKMTELTKTTKVNPSMTWTAQTRNNNLPKFLSQSIKEATRCEKSTGDPTHCNGTF